MRTTYLGLLLCSAAFTAAGMAHAQGANPPTSASSTVATNSQAAPPAAATDANPQSVAEVVVTAQKRTERLQEVPVAVTVVSADQLQRQQITQLTDLNRAVPSLEFGAPGGISPGGGGIIRGIGTVAFSESAEPSVGVVVDGVTQFNTNISDLFDISRVEVLEGPQGTLFGQSVSAGVINITTPTPDPSQFSGFVHSQLSGNGFMGSDYGRQIVQGMVNIPVTDNSALRLAAHYDHFDDIQKNSFYHNEDDTNDYGLRARYYWAPRSDLRINIIGDYNNAPTTGGDFITYRSVPAGSLLATDLAACGVTASNTNSTTCGSNSNFNRTTTYGVSGQVDYDLLGDTLTSITSYRKRILASRDDIDGFPFGVIDIPLDILNGRSVRNSDYFTQEVRLASPSKQLVEYTLGAFYSRYSSIYQNPTSLILNFGGPPVHSFLPQTENTYISSAALFGNLTFHLTDHFRLIMGGRYTHDSVTDSLYDLAQTPNYGGAKDTVDNLSWRIGAQYDVNRNLMGYITVSRGFKGPQVNDGTLADGVTVVKPEIPQNYELGAKATVLNGRLGLNGDVFYEVVHDFQSQVCTPNINNLGVDTGELCQPSNVPQVVSRGVEANLFGKPIDGLTVNAGYIYNPATYPKGYAATDGTDVGGQQLAYTSKTKITLNGNYERQITDNINGFVAVNATYRSQVWLYTSSNPNYLYPSYWTLGGEIGVRLRQGWKLSIFGQNLTDESVPAIIYPSQYSGLLATPAAYQQSPRPRAGRWASAST
jgi:iron complex outermembrane recepter protein